jgi:predicted nucleic acid-binding protein
MTSNRRLFVDSSVLIESEKGRKTDLFRAIIELSGVEVFISTVVVSEFLFHYLTIGENVSPRTVKERGDIRRVLGRTENHKLVQEFTLIDIDPKDLSTVADLMADFNLLPNDALIVATCLSRNIGALASFDPDFHEVCQTNGLALLDSAEELQNWLNQTI